MKRRPRPCPSRLIPLLALCTAPLAAAVIPTEWSHRQAVVVAAPGLVSLAVPAATFDAAQPGLADLRLLDANGQETAFLLDRDPAESGPSSALAQARLVRPRSFHLEPAADATQLVFETGTPEPLESITLETSAAFFLKAAHVETSGDGQTWASAGPAVPVFRQFGAEQLRLMLPRQPAAFLRVTVDDFRSRRIVFTGASLLPAPGRAAPPALASMGAAVTRRDEFAGETVLTVALDGRQMPLAELALETREPLFMRRVTVTVREVQGDIPRERVVGSGTIYRVALDGKEPQARLAVPLDFAPATRELLVHIHNGDSPPLAVDGVQARQHPVHLLFLAAAAGTYRLLSGNPQAAAPRYDLAAFAGEMRTAAATPVTPGPPEDTPDYHPRETLAEPPLSDVPLAGAPLDAKGWSQRRTLHLVHPGVQELELDPAALARSRPDFADLRLVHAGNQIPYVLEQPPLARALKLQAVADPDPKRPTVSRWRIVLPEAGLPLHQLVLTSRTPLFSRQFRVYEYTLRPDGSRQDKTLATDAWSRTPEPGVPETHTFELWDRPAGDTLWLEADNGDNPAIALDAVQSTYPVVLLIFKVAATDDCTLLLGNPAAATPRYDLSLVAVKLLTAGRNIAGFATEAPPAPKPAAGLNSGWFLWGALALVVVVLLGVVAKLLPKPPASK